MLRISAMSPLQYLQGHVAITSSRCLLYNQVFNRHRKELDDEETDRRMSGQVRILKSFKT